MRKRSVKDAPPRIEVEVPKPENNEMRRRSVKDGPTRVELEVPTIDRRISRNHTLNPKEVAPFHTTLPMRKDSVIIKDEENRPSHFSSTNLKSLLYRKVPVTKWLPTYSLSFFLQDLLAGFTVGLTEIPQGIAYAAVAGLSSQYGLYSGIMGGTMYFIFGNCKDINMGPTAIMALMVQPYVGKMGHDAAALIAFITGLFVFLAGILHLGFLVEFFSYPVISGFTTAAAISIACSQINALLGITRKSGNFLEAWEKVFRHSGEARKWDMVLGFVSIACLFGLRQLKVFSSLQSKPEWSRGRNILGKILFYVSLGASALCVVTGTSIAYVADKYYNSTPFLLTGHVKAGLPHASLPPFETTFNGTYFSFKDMLTEYGIGLAVCPMIAFLEHIAIVKAFSKGKIIDASQEMIALGIGNMAGSFLHAMPITGSFTRTAVNNAAGVKTTVSAVVTCLMLVASLSLLTRVFQYIPKSTLAAVIMVSMYFLCEFEAFKVLWRTKKLDLIPFAATLFCCLLISLEMGIVIGIGTNLTFILYDSARPKLYIEKSIISGKVIYEVQPKVGLYFVSSEYLRLEILKDCNVKNSLVIIDGEYVRSVDATVAKSFDDLSEDLKRRNQKIIFWNFSPAVQKICTGESKKMLDYFKNDTMDNITKDFCDIPISLSLLTVENGRKHRTSANF